MKQKLNEIFKNSSTYIINSIILQFFGLLLVPVYTKLLTRDEYGTVSLMITFSAVLVIILNLGQSSALIRFSSKKELENKYIGNIFKLTLIYPLVICIILIIFGGQIFSLLFNNISFFPYGLVTIIYSYFVSFNSLLISFYISKKQSRKYSIFIISRYLFMTLTAIIMIGFLDLNILGRLLAFLISELCFFIFAFIVTKKYIFGRAYFKNFKVTFRYGVLLVPHLLAGIILSSSDKYMLEIYSNLSSVGIYSLGYTFGVIPLMIASAFDKTWTPLYIENYEDKESDKLFAVITKYFIIILAFVTFCLIIFSKELIIILADAEYLQSYTVIPIIAIGAFFMGIYFLPSKVFFYQKKTYILSIMTIVAAVINITLNIILIPIYDIYGAAIATLISYFIVFVIVFTMSQNSRKIPYQYRSIFSALIIFIFLSIVAIYFPYITPYNLYISLAIKVAFVSLAIILLMITKSITKEELSDLKDAIFGR